MSSSTSAALRRDLATSSFSVETVGELWGDAAAAALFRGQRLPALRMLEERRRSGIDVTRAETLATLFVLTVPVPECQARAALPNLGIEGALELGLLERLPHERGPSSGEQSGEQSREQSEEPMVRALLDLRPYSFVDSFGAGSWWIVSDLGELALGGAIGVDHVLGVGGASTTLSGLMINAPVDRVLDLGTGCGIQALHASRHARLVIATDISERALTLAELNAELNAVDNIEFRLGSLFDPVKGEHFDQIVSNPPVVITPRLPGVPLYEYRDAGLVGDTLVSTVIAGAEEHLAPGGIAQLLGNWEYRETRDAEPGAVVEEDGLDRVRSWVDGTDLDVWVIERELQDAPQYAETWIRDGGTRPGSPEFDALYAAWLDDFEQRNVTHVGFGYVLLRRALAPRPLRRFERLDGARGSNPGGMGEYFAASLIGHDWQAARTDEQLLASTVVYASDVTEERHYWPGQENPTVMTLRQGSGFARTVALDTALAALVGACDGDLALGQIIGAIAHLLDADEASLVQELLPRIRALIDDALLLPEVR